MRRRVALFLLTTAWIFALGAPARCHAGLTMHLDTVRLTYGFTGFDTGTLTPIGGGGLVSWSVGGTVADSIQRAPTPIGTGMFTTTVGTTGLFGEETAVRSNTDNTILVNFNTSTAGVATIAGGQVNFSYAELTGNNRTALEALIGTNIPLNDGSGFGSLTVVAGAATPEPSSCLLMGIGMGVAGLVHRRNRRKRKQITPEITT